MQTLGRTFLILALLTAFGAQAAEASLLCRSVLSVPSAESAGEIFRTRQDQRLLYQTHGNGEAPVQILFLSGIDKNLTQWESVRASLLKERPDLGITQIDLLGQGATARLNHADSPAQISYRDQVSALKEMIQARGLQNKRLILVGHSYGGGIAARLARENPEMVRELILIAPFVDRLEVFQPGVGPLFWWAREWARATGMKEIYEAGVQMGAEAGTALSWPMYSFWHSSGARQGDVIALSRGIRDLEMSESLRELKGTRVHLMLSQFDELIPASAHLALWSELSAANRGRLSTLLTPHDSIQAAPDRVAREILDSISP